MDCGGKRSATPLCTDAPAPSETPSALPRDVPKRRGGQSPSRQNAQRRSAPKRRSARLTLGGGGIEKGLDDTDRTSSVGAMNPPQCPMPASTSRFGNRSLSGHLISLLALGLTVSALGQAPAAPRPEGRSRWQWLRGIALQPASEPLQTHGPILEPGRLVPPPSTRRSRPEQRTPLPLELIGHPATALIQRCAPPRASPHSAVVRAARPFHLTPDTT